MYGARITEQENLAATIQSVSGVGSYYSDAISLNGDSGRRFEADVNVGTPGVGGTVDFEFQWSATSAGAYATVTGAKITQDATGGKTHRVELSTEQILQLFPTARFIKGYLKTLVAATPTGVTIRGTDTNYRPTGNATSSIGQIVNAVS
jgi:hypothetical protein